MMSIPWGTLLAGWLLLVLPAVAADPLPSWRDGEIKSEFLSFVAKVTDPQLPTFVPPTERIAVFDHDGTLWCEQPMYVQMAFTLDAMKARLTRPANDSSRVGLGSFLKGEMRAVLGGGEHTLLDLAMATHAGLTPEEYDHAVTTWMRTARHPRFERSYTECVYQPMLDVLTFLRAKDFKTYVVTAGSVEFLRPWSDRVYGIPPEQIIGSMVQISLESREGQPTLVRKSKVENVCDKAGKPVSIQNIIGRRPVIAFGNSDGDIEMLEWTTAGPGARLAVVIHHTDAEREYAYDREAAVGTLNKGLKIAAEQGWLLVNMQRDWRRVFPFEP